MKNVRTDVHTMVLIVKKSKTKKTSKGYRLKVSTHRLIEKMQKMLNANQDTVITKACKMLYKEISNSKH